MPGHSLLFFSLIQTFAFTIKPVTGSVSRTPSCCAKVAELADAPDLGSGAVRRGGSSPPFRTNLSSSKTKPETQRDGAATKRQSQNHKPETRRKRRPKICGNGE